jgi:hypothetical protein
MISHPTAFILGAGASIPYGFISGEGLHRDARVMGIQNLRSKTRSAELEPQLQELHKALQQTHDSSLDALLELRPDIARCGKRLMASILLELEWHSPQRFPEPNADWITFLFEKLVADASSLEQFAQNLVYFITYNYDRLLEHRLAGALEAHYGRPLNECVEAMRRIHIVHLHGDLGLLPEFADVESAVVVPYGPSLNDPDPQLFTTCVNKAADRIMIVHEAQPETYEFQKARQILRGVERTVMLGFGYGATNLSRLKPEVWNAAAAIWGTVFGMSTSRIEHIVRPPIEVGGRRLRSGLPHQGAREFLDNHHEIFSDADHV